MGLFNRNNRNKVNEGLYNKDGYIIGIDSHKIYHVLSLPIEGIYNLPEGTTGISETAITEMRNKEPEQIIVPGTFKKFNAELLNFTNLKRIILKNGVEEVNCFFGDKKGTVNIILPVTIKKIGANNYPLSKNLVLPNGVVEIGNFFASHDTNLTSVNIPGTIKTIPTRAFNQCKNLQSIILNEGVETSEVNAFFGTNKLQTLVLPSTYNGKINLGMEARNLTSVRGSIYNGKDFEKDKNEILGIKIRRKNKNFEFNIKRGEQPIIEINQNVIKMKGNSQEVTIDCEYLQPDIYMIENGNLIKQEEVDKLDIMFQQAYRDNITKREDFVSLSNATKMQVKKATKELFLQINNQFGTTNTDYEMFDYIYGRALKKIQSEENIKATQKQDINSTIDTKKTKH